MTGGAAVASELAVPTAQAIAIMHTGGGSGMSSSEARSKPQASGEGQLAMRDGEIEIGIEATLLPVILCAALEASLRAAASVSCRLWWLSSEVK